MKAQNAIERPLPNSELHEEVTVFAVEELSVLTDTAVQERHRVPAAGAARRHLKAVQVSKTNSFWSIPTSTCRRIVANLAVTVISGTAPGRARYAIDL